MVRITKADKAGVVGEARVKKDEMKKVFDFCKSFDMNNEKNEDTSYLFDVRSEAIHWLDPKTKNILSSLYYDLSKGDIRIESSSELDKDAVIKKWKEIIEMAERGEA